jgi:predicted amidohydrolase YtcJ
MTDGARKGVSRRDLLKGGAAAGAAAAAGLAGARPASAAPPPPAPANAAPGRATQPAGDLILHDGRIHTMDGGNTIAKVIAIEGGRITYVGDNLGAIGDFRGRRPEPINLHGRTVIPGIIDCHNHIVLMGNRPGHHTPLENASSIADVQATYAARAARVPAGEFITTIGGFHPNHFAERRLPTLAELDAAVPDHPAFISIGFIGPAATNSLGKAFFERVPPPDGPVTVSDTGAIAAGTQNGRALLALRRALTFEQRKQSVRDAMAYAVSVGVTTHLDQGAFQAVNAPSDGAAHEDNFSMYLPFLSVYSDGDAKIRLRINFLYMDSDAESAALGQRLLNAFPFFGNDMVRTGGIGEFVAPDPTAPITNPTANNIRWLNAARKVAQARWRAEVHSLTATDFQAEIDGFVQIDNEIGIRDLRWVVAHVPQITAEYLNRLKAIGGGVNLTGWQYLAGSGTAAGPPFRLIVDNGIHAGMSSDGMQIAPMNPFIHAYYATTGKNAVGNVINVGQQITRQELLTLYTRANGWFLGQEDENQLGTLEVGRLGDLVVLDRDYFTVPVEELRQVRSALTVLGGEIVHDTGEVR